MRPDLQRLTDPRFVLALLLLTLNDHALKQAWPGLLTGKLSDVAGLFAFGWFALAFLPTAKRAVLWGCALLFAWWKSPFSQGAIDLVNAWGWVTIGRVEDPWDLLALVALPIVHYSRPSRSNRLVLARPLVAVFALFLFTATSMVRYVTSGYEMDQEWAMKGDRHAFWTSLDGLKLSGVLDTVRLGPAPDHLDRVRYCWNHFNLNQQHINSATLDVWGGRSRTHARLVRIEPVEDSTRLVKVDGQLITMHYGAAQAYYRQQFKALVIRAMKSEASKR